MAKRRTLEELEDAWTMAALEAFAGRGPGAREALVADVAAIELVEALAVAIIRRPAEAKAWASRREPWRPSMGLPWLSDVYLARLIEVLDG